MNALVVGGAPAPGIPELVRQLAPAADLVVAADAGAAACLDAGVVPDVVVGDLDSLEPAAIARLERRGVPISRVPVDKDVTDLDLAIDLVRARGATEVTATGVVGGRLDHTLAALGALSRAADLRPVLEDPDLRAWILDPQGRGVVDIGPLGATISVVPFGDAIVSCSGMRYPLSGDTLPALGSRGISNVVTSAEAWVEVRSGTILVIHQFSSGSAAPQGERA